MPCTYIYCMYAYFSVYIFVMHIAFKKTNILICELYVPGSALQSPTHPNGTCRVTHHLRSIAHYPHAAMLPTISGIQPVQCPCDAGTSCGLFCWHVLLLYCLCADHASAVCFLASNCIVYYVYTTERRCYFHMSRFHL